MMAITHLLVSTLWLCAPGGWRDDLKSYFLTEKAAERRKLETTILSDPDCTDKTLLEALQSLQLWEPQATGIQEMDLRVGRAANAIKQSVVCIPEDYDPGKAWPLVITLHGQGQSAASMMQMTRAILGDAAKNHLIVAPQDIGPLGFTEPSDVVDQPRQLLISLRKRFHIDSDRVFLMGYSIGGHNTWMAGIMHADCFAGIMPLATPLQVIGNDLLYDVLAPNLRNLSTLFVWGARDNLGQDGRPHPQGGNAAMSRKLAEVVRKSCGERVIGVELPDAGHGNVKPPKDRVAAWLKQKRTTWPKHIHQRFRLTGQSRAAWIRAVELMGKPLADAPSTVKLKPGEDPAVAQKRHLVAQLGLIEATVDNQTITITTKKVKDVVLLLSEELIDMDKPITVIRNKREVFSGRVYLSFGTMLLESAETFDFARLPQARLVIPASGKIRASGKSEH